MNRFIKRHAFLKTFPHYAAEFPVCPSSDVGPSYACSTDGEIMADSTSRGNRQDRRDKICVLGGQLYNSVLYDFSLEGPSFLGKQPKMFVRKSTGGK